MHNPSDMVQGLQLYIDLIRDIPGEHEIIVCGAGRGSSYLATLAILMGCHLRVGTEDTIYKYPHKDERVTDNGEDIRRYKQLANLLGREVATPDEYREIAGIE
jgi:3-keto-5-aminohexanoate cleavage enzyme